MRRGSQSGLEEAGEAIGSSRGGRRGERAMGAGGEQGGSAGKDGEGSTGRGKRKAGCTGAELHAQEQELVCHTPARTTRSHAKHLGGQGQGRQAAQRSRKGQEQGQEQQQQQGERGCGGAQVHQHQEQAAMTAGGTGKQGGLCVSGTPPHQPVLPQLRSLKLFTVHPNLPESEKPR